MIETSIRMTVPNLTRLSFLGTPRFSRGRPRVCCQPQTKTAPRLPGRQPIPSPWPRCRWSFYLSLAWFTLGFLEGGLSQDWPQILGPNRDGQATAQQLHPQQWPERLTPAWKVELGNGHAGAAIVGSRVLIPHRRADSEVLTALELESGGTLWECSWPASYQGTITPDDGPRCVPVCHKDWAVCYGAAGDLVCINLSNGEKRWQRTLRKDYDAEDGYFGAGSSPLIVNDLVITCVGGEKGGVVAVELDSGRTRWTSTGREASYASPIHIKLGSEDLLLVVTRLDTLLLNARDGSLLSEVKFGSRGPTVNAATPIALGGNDYLLTASYGVGTLILGIDGITLVEKLRDRNLLASQYNTPLLVSQRILGIHGREDVGIASLRSIDLQSREVLWEQAEFGAAHLLNFQDQVLAVSLDGMLIMLDGQADAYEPLAQSFLPTGTYRALPAVSGNQLVLRASHGPTESELMMFRLQ